MFHFFGKTIDRVLFAVNFIIAVQLPAFIQQYSQRIAGHLDEAKLQLGNYQFIADQHYQGDLGKLVGQYQANSDPSIEAIGTLVNQLVLRTTELSQKVAHLQQSDYLDRMYYFFIDMDMSILQALIPSFQLSIPMETNALVTGFVFAIMISIISQMLSSVFSNFFSLKT